MHGFEYKRGQLQGERDRDELSLYFWLLAGDFDGDLSSQELWVGLFSFAQAVACLHKQPDRHVSPEKLRSDWWME